LIRTVTHGRIRSLGHEALFLGLIMLSVSAVSAGCSGTPRNKILSAAPSSVSNFSDDQPPAPALATAPSPAPQRAPVPPASQRSLLGQSVQGRPIEMLAFPAARDAIAATDDGDEDAQGSIGDSPVVPVLILAAIHGDETATAELTKELCALLDAQPRDADVADAVADRTVVIIPVANPDGFAAGTRTNAHGVDVNRNFPATNYRASRHYGTQPASEPETQALLRALDETNPRLIISIHSITRGRECNNYDGPAEPVARAMAACNGYRVAETIGYATPGSMGTYCGIDRHIPMITLELPHDLPGDQAWPANRAALLAAIREAK
jgi:protein MpaA